MNIILFDGPQWSTLLPLTYTRPIAEIRCGILTIREKWEQLINKSCTHATQGYLSEKFQSTIEPENVFVSGHILPDLSIYETIESLKVNQVLSRGNTILAFKCDKEVATKMISAIEKGKLDVSSYDQIDYNQSINEVNQPTDIFQKNGDQISNDLKLLGLKANEADFSNENSIFGNEIYIEEGAKIRGAILNSEDGPIHIGKDAEIMEGSVIRGPFSLGEHSTIKMSAKIYGDTTIGPHCKVGGEVSNVVMFGYSNKGHDGFIGNSVIGEWCNFGADTNSSNLKNNYSPVRLWSYNSEKMEETNLQFCGLIAGDHCKTGINTMLNTATVLGVCSNVFGGGFPPKFIPSFSWGGANKLVTFKLDKAYEVAQNMMDRRGLSLSATDKKIFQHIFLSDAFYRK